MVAELTVPLISIVPVFVDVSITVAAVKTTFPLISILFKVSLCLVSNVPPR